MEGRAGCPVIESAAARHQRKVVLADSRPQISENDVDETNSKVGGSLPRYLGLVDVLPDFASELRD